MSKRITRVASIILSLSSICGMNAPKVNAKVLPYVTLLIMSGGLTAVTYYGLEEAHKIGYKKGHEKGYNAGLQDGHNTAENEHKEFKNLVSSNEQSINIKGLEPSQNLVPQNQINIQLSGKEIQPNKISYSNNFQISGIKKVSPPMKIVKNTNFSENINDIFYLKDNDISLKFCFPHLPNSCWLNSILLAIIYNPSYRKKVLNLNEKSSSCPKELKTLKEITKKIINKIPITKKELGEYFKDFGYNGTAQDADEKLKELLNKLNAIKLPLLMLNNIITSNFNPGCQYFLKFSDIDVGVTKFFDTLLISLPENNLKSKLKKFDRIKLNTNTEISIDDEKSKNFISGFLSGIILHNGGHYTYISIDKDIYYLHDDTGNGSKPSIKEISKDEMIDKVHKYGRCLIYNITK